MTIFYPRNLLLTALLFLTFYLMFSRQADAIPAFARKYQTSCITCHSTFPKLNTFGETFQRSGYRIPDVDKRYVKEKPVQMGAPAWKEVWPDGVWPGTLPGLPPLSLLARSLYRYDNGAETKHDFTFPDEIELLSAGTIGDNISFFGSIALVEDNEFGGVELLFMRFVNILSATTAPRFLNLTIGQFEPAFIPLSLSGRLTHSQYLFSTATVGANTFTLSTQRGVEVNGIVKSRMEYAFGVVNGNGTDDGNDKSALDNNSRKDYYLQVGYKFKGIGLDGLGIEGGWLPGDWKERALTIGAFGYIGENRSETPPIFSDRFHRYGFNFKLQYGSVTFVGAIVTGAHDNPDGSYLEKEITTYLAEGDILLYPWLTGIVRYELADVTQQAKEDTIIAALTALIRANVKLTMEGEFHSAGEEADRAFLILEFAI